MAWVQRNLITRVVDAGVLQLAVDYELIEDGRVVDRERIVYGTIRYDGGQWVSDDGESFGTPSEARKYWSAAAEEMEREIKEMLLARRCG
jgi:hypothetical protein